MVDDPIVITGFARTPIGSFQGCFKKTTAPALGAAAIKAAIINSQLQPPQQTQQTQPQQIQQVIMGCVLSAGLGQAPARQASLHAGLPDTTPCTTVNKMCGSGMQAVIFAHDILVTTLATKQPKIIIAGGMENMTLAPYLLPKARAGYRMGHNQVQDHMFLDGLEDAYDTGKLMGVFADNTANELQITREQQDQFALDSLFKAQQAIDNNYFATEITEVAQITTDEAPSKAKPEKIPLLKPAFAADGTVTAANASSIADGAAAIAMMPASLAGKLNLPIKAKIIGHSSIATKPSLFTIAPAAAIQNLLSKINWSVNQVDLFEINEAFAVVTLAAIKNLDLPADKVNIHGGACALGHPIGASGARIICSLLSALKRTNSRYGVAALCIGGGEATAIAIERI